MVHDLKCVPQNFTVLHHFPGFMEEKSQWKTGNKKGKQDLMRYRSPIRWKRKSIMVGRRQIVIELTGVGPCPSSLFLFNYFVSEYLMNIITVLSSTKLHNWSTLSVHLLEEDK